MTKLNLEIQDLKNRTLQLQGRLELQVLVLQSGLAVFVCVGACAGLFAIGEPLRSSFTADAMRALLARYGFAVVRDQATPAIGAALSPEVARATRGIKHVRIATADRT